jgi:hypothetical protein
MPRGGGRDRPRLSTSIPTTPCGARGRCCGTRAKCRETPRAWDRHRRRDTLPAMRSLAAKRHGTRADDLLRRPRLQPRREHPGRPEDLDPVLGGHAWQLVRAGQRGVRLGAATARTKASKPAGVEETSHRASRSPTRTVCGTPRSARTLSQPDVARRCASGWPSPVLSGASSASRSYACSPPSTSTPRCWSARWRRCAIRSPSPTPRSTRPRPSRARCPTASGCCSSTTGLRGAASTPRGVAGRGRGRAQGCSSPA